MNEVLKNLEGRSMEVEKDAAYFSVNFRIIKNLVNQLETQGYWEYAIMVTLLSENGIKMAYVFYCF